MLHGKTMQSYCRWIERHRHSYSTFIERDWCIGIAQIEEREKEKAGVTLSLLQGQWMELLEYLARQADPKYPVRIMGWDFQQPVLCMLRERGLLPANAKFEIWQSQQK